MGCQILIKKKKIDSVTFELYKIIHQSVLSVKDYKTQDRGIRHHIKVAPE